MKKNKLFILLILITQNWNLFSQNEVIGKTFTANTGNICKGNFSVYSYKQLEFKDNKTVKIVEYFKKNYDEVTNIINSEGKKYNYVIKNNFINIVETDLKQIKIDSNKLIFKNLIFKEVKEKPISKIRYYGESGGKDGSYVNLEITKDSIKCISGSRFPSKKGKLSEKTSLELWKKINSKFNIVEFDKIESTESIKYRDDYDETIVVEINGEIHQILNGRIKKEKDINIVNFIELLVGEVKIFEEKINK